MCIKSAILITMALFCGQVFASESENSARKGRFLDITGYLSGATDGFRVVPFWKQWNAFLQINVEKNKHKHGVYVVPASALYYPPPHYGGYGLYVPPNFGGLAGGLQSGYRPMSLLFDDYKPMTATTLAPLNADVDDKTKLDLDINGLNYPLQLNDKNVSFLNLNMRDDRKTHKRDIAHKNQTEDEVVATVVELIATEPSQTDTTTDASTSESSVDPTTVSTSSNAPETTETSTQPLPPTTVAPPPPAATTTTPATTTEATSASISVVDPGFQPILDFYYGGTPNENANFIYFTTSKPADDLQPPTEIPNPSSANDRSDKNDFKPSIQYEYQNYRYDTDTHFVPIVGTKQIF